MGRVTVRDTQHNTGKCACTQTNTGGGGGGGGERERKTDTERDRMCVRERERKTKREREDVELAYNICKKHYTNLQETVAVLRVTAVNVVEHLHDVLFERLQNVADSALLLITNYIILFINDYTQNNTKVQTCTHIHKQPTSSQKEMPYACIVKGEIQKCKCSTIIYYYSTILQAVDSTHFLFVPALPFLPNNMHA